MTKYGFVLQVGVTGVWDSHGTPPVHLSDCLGNVKDSISGTISNTTKCIVGEEPLAGP